MRFICVFWTFWFIFGNHNVFSAEALTFQEGSYIVNICNLAPYPVITHAAALINGEYSFSDKELEAGQCETIVKTSANSGKPSVHLNAYPVANNTVVQYFRNEQWFNRAWEKYGSEQNYGGTDDSILFCVSNEDSSKIRRAANVNDCLANETLRAYSSSIEISDAGVGDWLIIDPVICTKVTELDFRSDSNTLDELANWANGLYYAINRLEFYKNPGTGDEWIFPTETGIKVRDHNGMFDIGIEVISAIEQTPLGSPNIMKEGDIILYFNGSPVFGYDIVSLVYDAGKNYGYKHANEVVFLRNGEIYKGSLNLFFDEDIWRDVFFNPNESTAFYIRATLLSAINEYLFYTQNIATCLIDSVQNGSSHYSCYSECKFYRDQILAAYKQFHPKEYLTGEIFGGVTYIGRTFLENMLVKNVHVFRGEKLYSRIIRAAVLESVEEGARTIFTSPPGASTEYLIESMKQRGRLQGAIGVGFQISPLLTSIAVAPMVIESYESPN